MIEHSPLLRFVEVAHDTPAYWATVTLRDALLRQPLGLSFSDAELRAEASSYHLACYSDGLLCACLVLAPPSQSVSSPGQRALKMRQVAVTSSQQGRGIGTRLVRFSEEFALELGIALITLHARVPVVPFYERLGYACTSEIFEEVGLPHRTMQKILRRQT